MADTSYDCLMVVRAKLAGAANLAISVRATLSALERVPDMPPMAVEILDSLRNELSAFNTLP